MPSSGRCLRFSTSVFLFDVELVRLKEKRGRSQKKFRAFPGIYKSLLFFMRENDDDDDERKISPLLLSRARDGDGERERMGSIIFSIRSPRRKGEEEKDI